MALQLDKALETGVTANYWRISQFDIRREPAGVVALVTTELFLSSAAKAAGKTPMDTSRNRVSISGAQAQALLDILYTKLKALPAYTGAIDVPEV